MATKTILTDIDEGILTITLNRPEALNAFSYAMHRELDTAFAEANDDDRVRAIIVTGAGKAYCAGMDLSGEGNPFGIDESIGSPTYDDVHKRVVNPPDLDADGLRDRGGKLALRIYNSSKPVIAAINGAAVGIGATMNLPMDFRLASENARIGFVFGRLGIVPEASSTFFLPRIVGMSQALEWTYGANIMDAQEALRGGLVKAVYPADKLIPEARALALRITKDRSPVGIALTRHMMYRNYSSPVFAHEIESLAMYYTSMKDGKQGVKGFLEKKAPDFKATVSKDMPPFFPWWD